MQSPFDQQNTEQRFIDLETKVSHQELLLEELHEVLYQQQQTIDSLQAKLEFHIKRVQDAASTSEISASERPPHY
ncbi:MAG: SlyX family protein [Bdellovibrionaceae bacterium]|nr:SlyX family protein [Bdellovibrio sp.]